MAPPIRIEWLESVEAIDLMQALAVRGIVGRLEEAGSQLAVVVHDPHEELERLLPEVVGALEGWLADRGREAVEVRVGDRARTVAPGGQLAEALRARALQRGAKTVPEAR